MQPSCCVLIILRAAWWCLPISCMVLAPEMCGFALMARHGLWRGTGLAWRGRPDARRRDRHRSSMGRAVVVLVRGRGIGSLVQCWCRSGHGCGCDRSVARL